MRAPVLQHYAHGDGSGGKAGTERLRQLHRTYGVPQQRNAAGAEGFQGALSNERQQAGCAGGDAAAFRYRQSGRNGVQREVVRRQVHDAGIGLCPAETEKILKEINLR